MARKRYMAEETIGKPREAEVALAQGQPVAALVRKLGVSEQTFRTWEGKPSFVSGRRELNPNGTEYCIPGHPFGFWAKRRPTRPRSSDVRQMDGYSVAPQVSEEVLMATKNKGGKNTKQPASRSPKEKRQAKREKKEAKVRGTAGMSRP